METNKLSKNKNINNDIDVIKCDSSTGTRTCNYCGNTLPLTAFYKTWVICKECAKIKSKEYYEAKKERVAKSKENQDIDTSVWSENIDKKRREMEQQRDDAKNMIYISDELTCAFTDKQLLEVLDSLLVQFNERNWKV
ncbi:MAG: hypothetical protein U9O94_03235 [Nanoarchaeota archaeon]|nr:hypothetical protein [Nanoarchaeota archaeon]